MRLRHGELFRRGLDPPREGERVFHLKQIQIHHITCFELFEFGTRSAVRIGSIIVVNVTS